jgi:hypothetical protein
VVDALDTGIYDSSPFGVEIRLLATVGYVCMAHSYVHAQNVSRLVGSMNAAGDVEPKRSFIRHLVGFL